jgi:hypothetical protein
VQLIAIFNPVKYRYTNRPNPLTPFPLREGGTIQSLSPRRREILERGFSDTVKSQQKIDILTTQD